jgi:hypothetical protein
MCVIFVIIKWQAILNSVIIKHHSMKTYGRIEVQLHLLLPLSPLTWLHLTLLTSAVNLDAASFSEFSAANFKTASHSTLDDTPRNSCSVSGTGSK